MPDVAPLPEERASTARSARVSLTSILVAANVAVFLWMTWKGVSPRHPNVERLRELGANFGPYTLGGEPWRLLTSNYIHFGWAHLLTNLVCLWGLGRLVEAFYSRKDYFLLYTVAGICGSLLSVYMNPLAVGAGASGAVFGLAGALLTTLRWGQVPITEKSRRTAYKQVLEFAGLNLVLGLGLSFVVDIDNYGHMGGLIGGGLVGLVLGKHLDLSHTAAQFRRIAWAALLIILVGTALVVTRARSYVVHLYRAQQSIHQRKYDRAITESQRVIAQRPDLVEAHALTGEALMAKGEFAKAAESFARAADLAPRSTRWLVLAATAYQLAGDIPRAEVTSRRILQLAPNDPSSHFLLGVVLLERQKYPEAEAALQQAIQLSPRPKAEYWTALGNVHLESNRPADAVADYERALAESRENPVALRGLAVAHRTLGHRAEASKYQAELLKLRAEKQKKAATQAKP